jgi:hypothetical protein
MTLMAIAAASFISSGTSTMRIATRQQYDIQSTHLCEAGLQSDLLTLWRDLKSNQLFSDLDTTCTGATANNPKATITGTIPGVGNYSVGVIEYDIRPGDPYNRYVTIRCVGWVDLNNNGIMDATEPRKIVDTNNTLSLASSKVFDYTYFVNNYGWMDGFGQNDLFVNGDMRANGDFNFLNGSPTVNGSVFASINEKLLPNASGLINTPPVKMSTSDYNSSASNNGRWRQAYNASVDGTANTLAYQNTRGLVFDSDAKLVQGTVAGAVIADATGEKGWTRTSVGGASSTTLMDQNPTSEVPMPDLSNIQNYINSSNAYVDQKQNFADGTANPDFGQGAYVKVWDTTSNAYQTISTAGVINGSAAMVGTTAHPVLIHGPVTFTQDAVIKGTISGQGTVYTGRNVHIVGSIVYANPPDFRGGSADTIDDANEKKDLLGLAARGSVIMGDTSTFTNTYPLQYMTPPFTHDRLDDNGNLIPAYNANQTDASGFKKYQSTMGDSYIHSIAEPISQIDAIMYTNFVGGGNIGTSGNGIAINGSIISKDEAMVVYSLPMTMNYDNRIKERGATHKPLIDINLPRSPVLYRNSWQERGFFFGK